MKKITVAEAFEILQEQGKYGINKRERQAVMAEYFSAPLYYKPLTAGRSIEDEKKDPTRTTAVAEGGTGIGKTLAYLVPAVLAQKNLLADAVAPEKPADIGKISHIIEENVERSLAGAPEIPGKITSPWQPKRVIVSTSSKLLQGQLLDKDLARIEKFLKNEFDADLKVVIAQGVGNFICSKKVEEFLDKDLDPDAMISGDIAALISLAKKLRDNDIQTFEDARDFAKTAGERDVLRMIADGENMFAPPANIGNCNACGKPCKYFSAILQLAQADVVVTNHHWTATKLIRQGLVLAKMDKEERAEAYKKRKSKNGWDMSDWVSNSVLIADEAHRFEEAIISSMTTGVRPGTLARRIDKLIQNAVKKFGIPGETPATGDRLMDIFDNYLGTLKKLGEQIQVNIEKMIESYKNEEKAGEITPEIWRGVLELADEATRQGKTVGERIEMLMIEDALMDPKELRLCLSWKNDALVHYVNAKTATLKYILDRVLNPEEGKKGNIIFDCTPSSMSISPVSVAPMLRGWGQWQRAVKIFTSATIATSDSENPFRYFVSRLGVNQKSVVSAMAKSPFNFKDHACVLLPKDLPNPSKDFEAWIEYQKNGVLESAKMTNGGALALFTSRAQMQSVYEAIEDDLKEAGLKPAMQGNASMATLRNMFVKHPNAVVFGLDSFWQGLDVPGEHLRNLMIMRLPFDPPNDPLVRANVEWEKERLRKRLPHLSDAAISGIVFKSFQVPRAVLHFRQGFGRLIRSEQDKGLVTVFDPRIATQAYGEKFLAALPSDIPVVRDWEAAKRVVEDLGIGGHPKKKTATGWRPRPAAMAIGA